VASSWPVGRAELAEAWTAHLQSRVGIRDERRRYSQGTVDLYRQRLRAHVLDQLGSRPVDELTVGDLRALIDRLTARGLAPGTVTSCLNISSGLLRYGVKQGQLDRNVARDLDRDDRPGAKRQSEPRYLTAKELERLFSSMREEPFRVVAMTCAYAALRISECLGLRWGDLDLPEGTLTVAGQLGRDGTWLAQVKTASSAATLPLLPALRASCGHTGSGRLRRTLPWWRRTRLCSSLRGGSLRTGTTLPVLYAWQPTRLA
jgi:integrase